MGPQRGRQEEDVLLISADLRDELFSTIALIPLSCVDMRLVPSSHLVCSDASGSAEAAVRTRIGAEATRELQKYGLQKGMWNKLLTPLESYMREKGVAEETASREEEYTMHPAWQTIAETKVFERFGKVRRVRSRRHINVGELRAALAAEKEVGKEEPSSYYVHLQDSQVSLAALVKGRSSSRPLNQEMRRSIPDHVRFNTRPFYGFLRSAVNPADDPTREVPVRSPSKDEPEWLISLQQGEYGQFDEEMKRLGSHLSQMTGLPAEEELKPRLEVDMRSSGDLKRARRRERKRCARKAGKEDRAVEQAAQNSQALGAERQSPVEETGGELATDLQALGAERQSPVEETGGELATELAGALSVEAACEGPALGYNKQPTFAVGAERQSPAEEAGGELATGQSAEQQLALGGKQVQPPAGTGGDALKEAGLVGKPENFSCAEVLAARMRWKSKELRRQALFELKQFDRSQFLWSEEFESLEEAISSGPGVLDLFSGSRGFAKAMVRSSQTWALTFDIEHSVSEDLSKTPLQQTLVELVRLGLFAAMGAGPVCASFSTAITPPVRSTEYPQGVPWCTEKQQLKNEMGNNFLAFVLEMVLACLAAQVIFFVENPDGSWIWRQKRPELSWDSVMAHPDVTDFRTDFCRFGTRWRKRTKFRTNCHLGGQKLLCTCQKPHVVLRGRCKQRKMNMTKLAEPYPRGLCNLLAAAIARDAGFLGERRRLDVGLCAKQTNCRIGEASNPGPRRPPAPRPSVHLGDVELLEPATIAIRARVMQRFLDWFESECPEADFQVWLRVPSLAVSLLVAFGYHAFESGCPLFYYRQLLAHMQREHPQLRLVMFSAWDTVRKWEMLEPIQHRPPMPEPLVRAMAAIAVSWRWTRWAAVLLGCFFSICRIGEFIKARRRDVLLPSDVLDDSLVVYVKISEPKTRRRGARSQYATIVDPLVVEFVSAVWSSLAADEFLFGSTAGAFRYRWDKILHHIGVTKVHRLTTWILTRRRSRSRAQKGREYF